MADAGDGEVLGLAGFIREAGAPAAGMFCPIVRRNQRGKGLGGELLRQAMALGSKTLGIGLAAAGIGTRNRGGYSLLTSHGFRPVRQHFLMRCERARLSSEPPPADLALEVAQPDDADAILELYSTCGFGQRSRERMQTVLGDGRHAHGVARAGGRVVAFVELETHWPRRVWVAFVGVVPELRARGLGSALTAWALGRQFEAGAEVRAADALAGEPHRGARLREGRLPPTPPGGCAGEEPLASGARSEPKASGGGGAGYARAVTARPAAASSSVVISREQFTRSAGPPTPTPRVT